MSIRIELKNEKNTITLSGRIDGQTCKEVQDNLMPFITEGEPSIKIDCKKVFTKREYIFAPIKISRKIKL